MQEWLIWPLSKSGVPKGTEGSNPSLSARNNEYSCFVRFLTAPFEVSSYDQNVDNKRRRTHGNIRSWFRINGR